MDRLRSRGLDIGGASYVVRLFGPDTGLLGIDRAAEWTAARAAAEAGVAPEVVAFLPEHRALVTRFLDADPLRPEDVEREDVLVRVVTAVRAIHAMPPIPSTFSAFRVVREYRRVAAERGVRIPRPYATADRARTRRRDRSGVPRAAPAPVVPYHNDLLNANFLVRDGRVHIVDYEYAGMGDPFFDLANFSVNNGISEPRG